MASGIIQLTSEYDNHPPETGGNGAVRYALYFIPQPGSPWWNAGCRWLGLDPVSGALLAQPVVPGIAQETFHNLTAVPRRYGFHATLKAPFRLAAGLCEDDLLTAASLFAAEQSLVPAGPMRPKPMRQCMALFPPDDAVGLNLLARRVIEHFDSMRATLTESEAARYRSAGLTPRQDALLMRWGYPYVEEEFRFHLTLTGSLQGIAGDALDALYGAAREWFGSVSEPFPDVDALTVLRDSGKGKPLELIGRFRFGMLDSPASGTGLFY